MGLVVRRGLARRVAISASGEAFGWGLDTDGQAGSSSVRNVDIGGGSEGQPVTKLDFPGAAAGHRVVEVGAGFLHSYAITCGGG